MSIHCLIAILRLMFELAIYS